MSLLPLLTALAFHREHVAADVYHYSLDLPDGVELHRVVRELAPFLPRPAAHAAMLVHGDFADFATSFVPGVAPYLAAHDIDVWGVDRRWAHAADGGGLAQDLGDLHTALAFARLWRGGDRPALVGFSHGAQIAYNYAATDGRDMDSLATLDFFGAYAPADADLRAASCANAEAEYELVAEGVTDSPNDFFIEAGTLDRDDPDGASPLLDGYTNHEVVLTLLGATYEFAPITPDYQLLALDAAGDAFAHTSEAAADAWLSGAPPHESMLEAADLDDALCTDIALSAIHQPLLYIGAADAVGAHGLYTAQHVASTDVTAFVVPGYGHGDLLFGDTAPQLVWQPLATWLAHH